MALPYRPGNDACGAASQAGAAELTHGVPAYRRGSSSACRPLVSNACDSFGTPTGVDRYDSIIIGAGHNGLTCAAYLARAGQHVLVVEASSEVGGLAATREFHPGFRASVAHTESQFSPAIARNLDLAR